MNLTYDENQAIDALTAKMKELDHEFERESSKYSMLLTQKVDSELKMEKLKSRIEQCASAIGMIRKEAA